MMRAFWKEIKDYCNSHIWCSMAVVILICCVLFGAISQIYLKHSFTAYLTDNTIHAEEVILDVLTENIAASVKQITDISYEAATDDGVRQLAEQIRADPGNSHLNLMMEEKLNSYAHYSKWILGISISDENQVYYQYDKKQKSIRIWDVEGFDILAGITEELSHKMKNGEMPKIIATLTRNRYPDQEQHRIMHISVPMIRRGANNRTPMILTMTVNTEFLEEAVSGVYQSNEGVATGYLLNEDGIYVYHSDPALVNTIQAVPGTAASRLQLQKPLGELSWIVCIDIDKEQLLGRVDSIYANGMVMMIAAAVVVIAAMILIIWNVILKPLRVLIQGIASTGKNDVKSKITIDGGNEVWQVAAEFNEMIVSLEKSNREAEESYQQRVIALKQQRDAEREALESQINAHFICNTINIINYEAIDAGNRKVSELLKRLSNILRYTFDQKHQSVFFYQEILWVEQYLYLQKTRFEDLFDYRIDFDADIQGWPCRKLMLQPFVENSIIHGMAERKAGGMIVISGNAVGEKGIRIVIDDNGKGMLPDTEARIREVLKYPYQRPAAGLGIGISNVAARIYDFYGPGTSIVLENTYGQGCRFIFTLYQQEDER